MTLGDVTGLEREDPNFPLRTSQAPMTPVPLSGERRRCLIQHVVSFE